MADYDKLEVEHSSIDEMAELVFEEKGTNKSSQIKDDQKNRKINMDAPEACLLDGNQLQSKDGFEFESPKQIAKVKPIANSRVIKERGEANALNTVDGFNREFEGFKKSHPQFENLWNEIEQNGQVGKQTSQKGADRYSGYKQMMFEIYKEEKRGQQQPAVGTSNKSLTENIEETHALTVQLLIDLYLGVKIRKTADIVHYNDDLLREERLQLLREDVDAFTLIDYIKQSIEVLINLKNEEYDNKKCKKCAMDFRTIEQLSESEAGGGEDIRDEMVNQRSARSKKSDLTVEVVDHSSARQSLNVGLAAAAEYEQELQRMEAKERNHISVENQLQHQNLNMQTKLMLIRREMDQFKDQQDEHAKQLQLRDQENNELKQKLEALQESNKQLESTISALRRDADAALQEKERIQNQYTILEKTFQSLKSENLKGETKRRENSQTPGNQHHNRSVADEIFINSAKAVGATGLHHKSEHRFLERRKSDHAAYGNLYSSDRKILGKSPALSLRVEISDAKSQQRDRMTQRQQSQHGRKKTMDGTVAPVKTDIPKNISLLHQTQPIQVQQYLTATRNDQLVIPKAPTPYIPNTDGMSQEVEQRPQTRTEARKPHTNNYTIQSRRRPKARRSQRAGSSHQTSDHEIFTRVQGVQSNQMLEPPAQFQVSDKEVSGAGFKKFLARRPGDLEQKFSNGQRNLELMNFHKRSQSHGDLQQTMSNAQFSQNSQHHGHNPPTTYEQPYGGTIAGSTYHPTQILVAPKPGTQKKSIIIKKNTSHVKSLIKNQQQFNDLSSDYNHKQRKQQSNGSARNSVVIQDGQSSNYRSNYTQNTGGQSMASSSRQYPGPSGPIQSHPGVSDIDGGVKRQQFMKKKKNLLFAQSGLSK